MKLDIQCLDPMVPDATIVGMDWYDGKYGYMQGMCPALAICYESGRLQLMSNENDSSKLEIIEILKPPILFYRSNLH